MKYHIRKVTEQHNQILVEVELDESCEKYDKGDRFAHALPNNFDWEQKNPKTGNTYLYEKMQEVVRRKTNQNPKKSNVENFKKWQNLQFDSEY